MSSSIFPQYRKLKGLQVYYLIESEQSFTEIKKLGNKLLEENIVATQFPERLRIQDMLTCAEGRFEMITEEEYTLFKFA